MKLSRGRMGVLAALLALALAPASARCAQSQDYEIRLHRPDALGSSFHLSATAKESTSQVARQGDKILEDKHVNFSVEAELVVTVLAQSENGKNTRVKCEVEKLVRIEDGARRELAPKGSVITGVWDGQEQSFEMAGGGLEPDTEESLKLLDLVTEDPAGPTDDEVFGAKGRKKVGDHWEGNADLLAKDMTHQGVAMNKEDLKSSVTLEKIVTIGKTECMQLAGLMTCDKFSLPLPPDFDVQKSTLKFTFSGCMPMATSLVQPEETSTAMTMTLIATGKPDPAAPEIILQLTDERSMVARTTDVK